MKHIYRVLTGFVFLAILFGIFSAPYFIWGADLVLGVLYSILFILFLALCYCIGALVRMTLLKNDDGQ